MKHFPFFILSVLMFISCSNKDDVKIELPESFKDKVKLVDYVLRNSPGGTGPDYQVSLLFDKEIFNYFDKDVLVYWIYLEDDYVFGIFKEESYKYEMLRDYYFQGFANPVNVTKPVFTYRLDIHIAPEKISRIKLELYTEIEYIDKF